MKYIREKMFEHVLTLNQGTILTKLNAIRKRHKMSMNINDEVETLENGRKWGIMSLTLAEICTITKEDIVCTCKLICPDCESCIHKFKCSCIDSSIKWNMCKHIHFLNRYLRQKINTSVKELEVIDINNMEIIIDDTFEISDVPQNINIISIPNVQESIDKRESILLERWDDISNASLLETIDTLDRDITSIDPTMEIANNLSEVTESSS